MRLTTERERVLTRSGVGVVVAVLILGMGFALAGVGIGSGRASASTPAAAPALSTAAKAAQEAVGMTHPGGPGHPGAVWAGTWDNGKRGFCINFSMHRPSNSGTTKPRSVDR